MRRSRSNHNLSHMHLTSFNMGTLYPVLTEEVLPGDTFTIGTSAIVRVAPLVNPVMHPIELRLHYFYVPNRIIWDEWEDFIRESGEYDWTRQISDVPAILLNDATETEREEMRLAEYMGIPAAAGMALSCLPFRAYTMIWNNWYRDVDLQAEGAMDDSHALREIAWEKDYLTTARPIGANRNKWRDVAVPIAKVDDGPTDIGTWGGRQFGILESDMASFDWEHATVDPAGAMRLQDFRMAAAIETMREARKRYGDRYVDYLRWMGRNPSTGMIDIPERIGGGKTMIQFSEVLATAEGTSTNVGDYAGHGLATIRTKKMTKTFEEHGWVFGLVSARPKSIYMDHLPRKFIRHEPEWFYQPELEVLGEQAVAAQEAYAESASTQDWGYQARYDEYRSTLSYVSGEMRDINKSWHLARDFSGEPALNSAFVKCDPSERIFQASGIHHLIASMNHTVRAKRIVSRQARVGMRI